MRKNNIPTMDRGTSMKTKAAVLDRHFPPKKKTVEGRRILPMSKVSSRTSPSDRLPELLHETPVATPAKEAAPRKDENKREQGTAKAKAPAAKRTPNRVPPTPPTPNTDTGLLACPKPHTEATRLTQQSIPLSLCEERQSKGYHKCATCTFAKGRQFKGIGLPPLENSPAHLQHTRILGLFGPDGSWLRP